MDITFGWSSFKKCKIHTFTPPILSYQTLPEASKPSILLSFFGEGRFREGLFSAESLPKAKCKVPACRQAGKVAKIS